MKKLLTLFCFVLLIGCALTAQQHGPRGRQYEMAKEKTFVGVISSVMVRQLPFGKFVIAKFRYSGKTIYIPVAPSKWMKDKGYSLSADTTVYVTGVLKQGRRGSVIIPRIIKFRSGSRLMLRDIKGRELFL